MKDKKNWTGNKKSIYAPLGASNHSKGERAGGDYYATDPKTIDDLFKVEKFSDSIWENACGEGHLSKQMIKYKKNVYSTDKFDRNYGDGIVDFLEFEGNWTGDIITNPPYKYALEFAQKSLEVINKNNKVAMFLKLTFLEGQKRYSFFQNHPPKYVYIYSQRQQCAPNGKFKNVSAVCYSWFIWKKGYKGETTLRWIPPRPKKKKG